MLEDAERGSAFSKDQYDALLPALRAALLDAQARLRKAGFSVVVLINGADGAGKSETVNKLHEWLDARYLVSESAAAPTEEERSRPEYWRYWMWLPPAGKIALFSGSWYTRPILDRVWGKASSARLAADLSRINAFERTLADDGTLFVKLWFHVSKKVQRKRLKALRRDDATRYRVGKRDLANHARYDAFVPVTEHVLAHTSTAAAPWHVLDAADDRYRNVTAARTILDAIEARLARQDSPREPQPLPHISDPHTVLDELDLSLALGKHEYQARVLAAQAELSRLVRKLQKREQSAILVFEGPDAAGKGGAIRRITWALDARSYRLIPVSAPSDEERAHHYLWRFWRYLPRRGRLTIFDRSWYGRVLVERVEGFASEAEWRRAYQEINELERELTDAGVILVKLWLHIGSDEQLRRFEQRKSDPAKRYKITAEDYRNRTQEHQYEAAAAEMLSRCSPPTAPFVLVEANDKRYARVKVLESVVQALARRL